MLQFKLRVIDKAIPWSNPNKENKKLKSEFNCYKCFKIMILDLSSEDQEGPVKLYCVGPRECYENIHQHCMYLALTAYVLYLLLV